MKKKPQRQQVGRRRSAKKKPAARKSKAKRTLTLRAVADELGLPLTVLREWSQMPGGPFDKQGPGKPTLCDPAEVTAWANEKNLTGKPGRPGAAGAAGSRSESDYWLARYRKVKTLKEENSVIDRAEFLRIVAHLASVTASELKAMPAAVSGGLFGRTPAEIEAELDRYVGALCDRLANPATYAGLEPGDDQPGDPGMDEALEAPAEAEAEPVG